MKKIFTKSLLAVFVLALSAVSAFSQTKTDEDAVRECLNHYMSGEGLRLEKAFHPSATMKYIDITNGEFKDVPIGEYISRVKTNTTRPDRKIGIESMNVQGTAAQAKIRIETEKNILYDYMNLLKINGEWKIVSKVFSRTDK